METRSRSGVLEAASPSQNKAKAPSWQRVGIRAIYLGVTEHTSDPSSMLGGRGRKMMNLRPTGLYKKVLLRRKEGREGGR